MDTLNINAVAVLGIVIIVVMIGVVLYDVFRTNPKVKKCTDLFKTCVELLKAIAIVCAVLTVGTYLWTWVPETFTRLSDCFALESTWEIILNAGLMSVALVLLIAVCLIADGLILLMIGFLLLWWYYRHKINDFTTFIQDIWYK